MASRVWVVTRPPKLSYFLAPVFAMTEDEIRRIVENYVREYFYSGIKCFELTWREDGSGKIKVIDEDDDVLHFNVHCLERA